MEMDTNLSSFNLDSLLVPTNKDVVVTFTPGEDVVSYQYRIFKNNSDNLVTTDGNLVEPSVIYRDYVMVDSNRKVDITLTDTGIYSLEIVTMDINGNYNIINSGNYVIDKQAPKISIDNYYNQIIEYKIGEDNLDFLVKMSIDDNYDFNLKDRVITNIDELDFKTPGLKKLTYTVSDQAGNMTTEIVNINAVKSNLNIIHFWQILIILCLLPIFVYLLVYNKAMKLEKRITKYSVEPIKKYSFSMVDKLLQLYKKIVSYMKPVLAKSVFITKHSKKYDKYVGIVDHVNNDGLEFVCSKIIVAIITLLLAIFSKTFQFKILSFEEFFIPLILGYLLLDIYYIIKYRQYRNHLEADLLQAIIVMNNAFKSGRSITQAIELVTIELEGPMAEEFKLMHLQLQFGLALDVVFNKFAQRVAIEEVNYLTASLTILNKTGGNIIKVFSSIEKTLFNKKKLKLELNSLTGSSKIIMYLLTALPLFLVLVINFVNPDYFLSLYTTSLGLVILLIIVIIYVSYIIVVRKIMKVRM